MQRFDSTSSFVYTISWPALSVYMETLRRAINGQTRVRLTSGAVSKDILLEDYTSYRFFRRRVHTTYGKPSAVSIYIPRAFSHSFLWALMPLYTPSTTEPLVATPEEVALAQTLANTFHSARTQDATRHNEYLDPMTLRDEDDERPDPIVITVNPESVIRLLHTVIPVRAAYIDPVTKAFTVQCAKGFCFSVIRGRDIFPHGPAVDLETGVSEDEVWAEYFPTMNQDVASWNEVRSRKIDTMGQVLLWHGACTSQAHLHPPPVQQ